MTGRKIRACAESQRCRASSFHDMARNIRFVCRENGIRICLWLAALQRRSIVTSIRRPPRVQRIMKIAIISDVHIGLSAPCGGTLKNGTEHSAPIVSHFVDGIRQSREYAFAVQLGDLIHDIDPEKDQRNLQMGIELFRGCKIPVHHVIGNHDTMNISASEFRGALGLESLWYSFDDGPFHFVILYSQTPSKKHSPICIPDDELRWLESDLSRSSKPTIVFVHHSLADQDLAGNRWFEGRPDDCLIENRRNVRAILSGSGKAAAVVNGHLHWNQFNIHDGIPYITLQSAIETINDSDAFTESWGVIELDNKGITFDVRGNDPARYAHRFTRF